MNSEAPKPSASESRQCFVVGPIGAPDSETRRRADWLLNGIIKPAVAEFDKSIIVTRADEIYQPGMIDSQVINCILDSRIVVADLSESNANAFYEIAIRHMIEKPIIHMIDDRSVIPFDVRPFRTIVFSIDSFRNVELAKSTLLNHLEEVNKESYEIDNPITRARGSKKLRESSLPKDAVIRAEIERLTARIDSLQNSILRPTLGIPKAPSGGFVEETTMITKNNINDGMVRSLLMKMPFNHTASIRDHIAKHPNGAVQVFRMSTGAYEFAFIDVA